MSTTYGRYPGDPMVIVAFAEDIRSMGDPVQCRFCGRAYDLRSAHPTARYADCTVYRTPCCNHEADDRVFKDPPDFQRIEVVR